MAVQVKLKYLRIAPRKARLVADMIRGKTVSEASSQLKFTVKKAAQPFEKLLRSGVATAENDWGYERSNLYLSEVRVDEGPTLKRVRGRAKGAFRPVNKRSCHLVLKLDQIEEREVKRPEKKAPAPAEEVQEEAAKEEPGKKRRRAPKGPRFEPTKKHRKSIFRRKAF